MGVFDRGGEGFRFFRAHDEKALVDDEGRHPGHADLAGLRSSDAVLALLDHSDSGTIFEVGWAVAAQIPVVGFGRVVEKEGMKMLGGSSVELHRDLATACYRAAWAAMGLSIEPGWMTT